MIKVIHVISDTNIGGAGTVLLTTLYNIDRSRFDVKVVLPEGSALIPRIDALGFETVPTKGGADKSLDFSAIHEYMRIFKREKPDIVHTHAAMAACVCTMSGFSRLKMRIYSWIAEKSSDLSAPPLVGTVSKPSASMRGISALPSGRTTLTSKRLRSML